VLPIEVAGLAVGDRRIATVRAADSGAHAEASLGEVQPVAHRPANAIVGYPADERSIDTSLKNQIFEQLSDGISCKGCNNGGAHAEASSQSTSNVVFSAALPGAEVSSGMDSLLAGIEPEHYFAETDAVPLAALGLFQDDLVHAQHSSCFECEPVNF
jgi:hypothetical protein